MVLYAAAELAKLKIENEKVKAERDSLHQAYGAL